MAAKPTIGVVWDRALTCARVSGASSSVRLRLQIPTGAIGAVVARFVHTEEVTGSNPVSPTSKTAGQRPFSGRKAASRATYVQHDAHGVASLRAAVSLFRRLSESVPSLPGDFLDQAVL